MTELSVPGAPSVGAFRHGVRLPWSTVVGPAIPATQTVKFGAETKCLYGEAYLGYTGGGTLTITAGNTGNVWAIVNNHLALAGTFGADPPALTGPYTLTIGDGVASSTVTVDILANTAHFAPNSGANAAREQLVDFLNAVTVNGFNSTGATDGVSYGMTCVLRDGFYNNSWARQEVSRASAPAGTVANILITSETQATQNDPTFTLRGTGNVGGGATYGAIEINGGGGLKAFNLKFQYVTFQSRNIGQAISSGTYDPTTGNIVLTLAANSQLNTSDTVYLQTLTGTGAFASLENVGYPVTATSGTSATITGPTGLAATTITGGMVVDPGASPHPGITCRGGVTGIKADHCYFWSVFGEDPGPIMPVNIGDGFYAADTGTSDHQITNCLFAGLNTPVQAYGPNFIFTNNVIHDFWGDGCDLFGSYNYTFSWNFFHSVKFVPGSGHPDFFQPQMTGMAAGTYAGPTIQGNVFVRGAALASSDGDAQGIFISNNPAGVVYDNMVIEGNLIINSFTNAITPLNANLPIVRWNTIIRALDGPNNDSYGAPQIVANDGTTTGGNFDYNYTRAISLSNAVTTEDGNIIYPAPTLATYQAAFANPAFGQTLLSDILASWTMKAGGSLDKAITGKQAHAGAIGTGYFDYVAMTASPPTLTGTGGNGTPPTVDGNAVNTTWVNSAAPSVTLVTTTANKAIVVIGIQQNVDVTCTGITGLPGATKRASIAHTFADGVHADLEVWEAALTGAFNGAIGATFSGAVDSGAMIAFGVKGATGFDPNVALPASSFTDNAVLSPPNIALTNYDDLLYAVALSTSTTTFAAYAEGTGMTVPTGGQIGTGSGQHANIGLVLLEKTTNSPMGTQAAPVDSATAVRDWLVIVDAFTSD